MKFHSSKARNSSAGFTLVETIIYVAIFSIFMTGILNFFYVIGNEDFNLITELQQNENEIN
jgi:type II secretory pathway pseudopilin PulG